MGCSARYCLLTLALCLVTEQAFGVRVMPKRKKEAINAADDQSTSASWWQAGTATPFRDSSNGFASTHGIVQTHPTANDPFASFGGIESTIGPSSNPFAQTSGSGPLSGTFRSNPLPPLSRSANGKAGLKHLDFTSSATAELRRNPALSAPDECARACRENEPPRICYYHFTLEFYTVLGAACQVCTPNATNVVWSHCQCVLADGVERGILSVNRMLPGPSIQVCENDKVVIDVENHMEGMEVTIHWHGIWQRGSQYYDGVPFVTQCPIQQGNTFRYQWQGNAGTHFWHAHTGLQKLDGLYGSIVVRQPPSKDPNSHLYDYDLTTHVMLISDWLHEDAAERYPGRLAVNTGQDPENVLINGKGQFRDPNTGFMTNTPLEVFTITPGRRYRFRMINAFASVCPAQVTFEGHNLTVIATDGEPVQPVQVNTIISFSGERYDFVIEANNIPGAYWIQVRGLGECGIKRAQQLGILRYARGPYQPSTPPPTYDVGIPQGVVLNPLDAVCDVKRNDAVCVSNLKSAKPVDKDILQERPDVKIFLPFRFHFYKPKDLFKENTYRNYLVAPGGDHVLSLVDEISYMAAPAPPLSQMHELPPELFCNGDNRPENCPVDCRCTHMIDVPLNSIVEIVLVDEVQSPNLSHPFHLHGTPYNVIGMGRSPDKNIKKINLKHALDLDRKGLLHRQYNLPPFKDTLAVPNNGYVVLRLKADNPGYWLFHCHFIYHIVIGMNLILHIGTQSDLPPVPPNFPRCGHHLPSISPPYYPIIH
ncbi:laccase-2 isoform X1 [Zerene cesonia]|uniref:laccase-2 isoform X1 n=1 Tax=Zerene cesonia TaxID=33412 RepID=UPI0018E4F208|nr:laccase-2 isoform X1 [Zerene cesonia]